MCVRACVVAPGTAAHCGGTHAGVCVCGCVCAVPTTPTTHAVHPCRLSLLALPIPHLPLTHTHGTPHATHTHGVLCVPPPIHSHTHWLPHCPHARHTHTPLGVRAPIHLLSSATTHTHTGRTGVAHAWVVGRVVTTTTPLVPATHTHTHSGTGGGRHGGAWWCGCGLCVPPTPPTTTPSLPPPPPTLLCHHRPHTHTRDLVDAPLPHTHATCTTTLTNACCVVPTPCHSLTHATSHTHPQWCLPSLTTPSTHTHTQRMPHTHHTGEGPRARTPVGVAFGEPPPPRWSWAFAVLCWWLLVHQPLFTLTHPSTPTPSSPNHHHHHPIHPVCVVCVVWERTAPGTTVVVKHATHTPVVHCVHGSHHPTLHPPLTPLLVLFPPPTTTPSLFSTHHHHHTHTTRPLWSSTAHSSASHTHMVWVACGFVAALSCCV